jgi:hypothetical protein
MTSPSWPVSVKPRPPGSSIVSTYSTSPPTSVTAMPAATPGCDSCRAFSTKKQFRTQHVVQVFRTRYDRVGLTLGETQRHLTGQPADRTLQPAYPGLARVSA